MGRPRRRRGLLRASAGVTSWNVVKFGRAVGRQPADTEEARGHANRHRPRSIGLPSGSDG